MEFHIRTNAPFLDPGAIDAAIRAVDPSALVDIDPASHALRVAASIDAAQLVALIRRAGYPVTPDQVEQVPSICCGGCSG